MPRRRRRTSPAEDLTHSLAVLPWWVCLGIALVAFLVLHAIAASKPEPITATGMQALPGVMVGAYVRGIATVGQFVVPVLFIVAALVSYLKRREWDQF